MPFELNTSVPVELSVFGDLELFYWYVLDYNDVNVVTTVGGPWNRITLVLASEVRVWLRDHHMEFREVLFSQSRMELQFRRKSDAILFKLVWGGE